jgi:tetratricopeptide (TPR) repeat protein
MVQPVASRRSVGPVAVQLGLITQEQLASAQSAQARMPGRSLDQVLVDRKLLTPDQVRSIQVEMNRGAAPAPSKPSHGTRRTVVTSTPAASKRMLVVAGAIALVPILGLAAYFALKKAPAETVEAPKPEKTTPPPPKDKDKEVKTPPPPRADQPKVEVARIRATLRKVGGYTELANRYNAAADKINSMRDPEQYKPVMPELEALVTDSKNSDLSEDVREAYKEVVEAIKKRGEQVFTFLSDEVASLKAAGKYGDALKAWEWFPGNLDLVGSYDRKITEQKKSIRSEADAYFAKSMGEIEALVSSGKLEDAHLLLLRALEIGIDDLYAKAEKRMTELTALVDDAVKKKNEDDLAAFERTKEAEKEASKTAALYQDQFWKFVSDRKLDAAQAFLSKQRLTAPAEVGQAIGAMEKALLELRGGFEALEKLLQAQAGKTASLAFLENGKQQNRSFHIKSVGGGRIFYMVEGRELSVPVSDLHSSEISKLAAQAPAEERSLLDGMARLLDGGFDEAHLHLTSAGSRAQGLVAFVEKSTSFLERNVPVMKERASRFVNEKQWELAIQEYTKLASLPAERQAALRGRARAYYQLNNFMAAVSDIDSLFEMDDFADSNLELLNQSFKRSALIDKAIRMYEKANAKKPEHVMVLASLISLYMQIHEFEKAKEALTRAQKLKGGGRELDQLAHLVNVALEPAFPGKTFRAQFGRYDLETNVSQEYATKMARFMSKVYESYIKVFPYKKNETLRFHLKLFATEGEFFSYYKRTTGADPAGPHGKILAYYMSVTKELVGWNAEGIEDTLQHEGLHQYFDYFIEDCPIWFNEGYASFFETSTADAVRFNKGRHDTAVWLMQRGELPSMKEIFMMSGNVFRAKGAMHYGSSWSVVYWFIKSGRKKILDRYFEALMEGKDQQQAFDAIFGPGKENIDDFTAQWKRAVHTENYGE